MTPSPIEGRGLLKLGGLGFTGLLLGTGKAIAAQDLPPPSPVDRGHVEDGKVKFPEWRGEADMPSSPPPAPLPPEKRVGFAVVALGRLSLEQILPAFSESKKAAFAAISRFAEEQKIGGASFTAIGAFSEATLGFFDFALRTYKEIPVNEQTEVLSAIGDIATGDDGKASLHVHVVLGLSDGSTKGGHLLKARFIRHWRS